MRPLNIALFTVEMMLFKNSGFVKSFISSFNTDLGCGIIISVLIVTEIIYQSRNIIRVDNAIIKFFLYFAFTVSLYSLLFFIKVIIVV